MGSLAGSLGLPAGSDGFSGIQTRRADGQKGEAQEEFGCVTGDALSVK